MSRSGKTGRNASGIGSIREIKVENKQGKVYSYWQGRVTIGYDSNGKQLQKSVSAKTQSELVKKINLLNAQIQEGTYLKQSKVSVAEWLNEWTRTYLNHVAHNTAHGYTQKIESYIVPFLGEISLQKLTNKTVQDWINKQLLTSKKNGGKGLSPKSIKDVHSVFHSALSRAVELGMIRTNPADNCSLPKIEKKPKVSCDITDVEMFLHAIDGHCHEIYYKTLLFTGIRESEGLGLTWDCIDFKKNLIYIRQQLIRDRTTGEYFLAPPKWSEYRTLEAPEALIDLLRQQKAKEREKAQKCGKSWEGKNLVFSNPTGGFLSYRTVYDCYKRVVRQIRRPQMKVHDLRHVYAALALDNGDDVKTLQENLGHATPGFSLSVYAYSSNSMKKASASRMNERINSLSGK